MCWVVQSCSYSHGSVEPGNAVMHIVTDAADVSVAADIPAVLT